MAYGEKLNPNRRAATLTAVSAIHLALGYALVVGLARAASVHIWPPAELFSIYVVMAIILMFKPEGLFQRIQARKI